LFAVEKVVARGDNKICHHPACLEMLRGFDFDSTPNNERIIVDCTDYNYDQWMVLPKECRNCCSSLWIGTFVCLASLEDYQSIRMVIPGEFARQGNYFELAERGESLGRPIGGGYFSFVQEASGKIPEDQHRQHSGGWSECTYCHRATGDG